MMDAAADVGFYDARGITASRAIEFAITHGERVAHHIQNLFAFAPR